MEGNKKEANKKEHCLSALRVFDSTLKEKGEYLSWQVLKKILHTILFIKFLQF